MPSTPYRTRAMMDMAAAVGHGARKTAQVLEWTPEATAFAEKWVEDRLKASNRDYWTDAGLREEALQRAFEVGLVVASNSSNGQITLKNIKAALQGFGIRKVPGPREYCPF